MISYHIAKLMSKVFCVLPFRLSALIGSVIGKLGWYGVPNWRKQLAIDNIIFCLGKNPKEAKEIARLSVERFGRMLVDVLRFPALNKDNLDDYVIFEGLEYLDAALAKGKGLVFATAHFGNWEIAAAALSIKGYPIISVARRQNNPAMDRFINEYRSLHGATVAYKTSVRDMVRFLGDKYCIGLLMDQDAGTDGLSVNFLGKPSSTPKGPAALARLKGAPIVPILTYSDPFGKHIIKLYPYLELQKTECRETDVADMTKRLVTIIEDAIKERPYEWFWLHNRWKTKK